MAHSGRSDSSPTTARAEAVRQLVRIEEDRAYVGLAERDEAIDLDPRGQRQATDYVAGVTRWRRWLDFVLSHYYRGELADMEPVLRQILRLGLYDLLKAETPPHAALNESVELAKTMLRRGAGRLVNGVLRAVQRADALPRPSVGDPAERLAIEASHPTWIVRRWLARYGPDATQALLDWNNARPTFGVRVNTARLTPDAFRERLDAAGAGWAASPYLDDFVRVQSVQPLVQAGLLKEGLCAVQDESAGLVVRLLDPQPGETILDGCAAPGGKALYAATRMGDTGTVLAYDIHSGRVGLIDRAAEAQGLACVQTAVADLRRLAARADRPQADRVLIDAPCSGLGVLAKRADLRWNRSPDDLAELTTLQDDLLDAAARLVRPGGLIVYSTCTIEPEENADRVRAFLDRHPAFRLEPAGERVPEAVQTAEGYLATLPQRHHVDGAFGACLRHQG